MWLHQENKTHLYCFLHLEPGGIHLAWDSKRDTTNVFLFKPLLYLKAANLLEIFVSSVAVGILNHFDANEIHSFEEYNLEFDEDAATLDGLPFGYPYSKKNSTEMTEIF